MGVRQWVNLAPFNSWHKKSTQNTQTLEEQVLLKHTVTQTHTHWTHPSTHKMNKRKDLRKRAKMYIFFFLLLCFPQTSCLDFLSVTYTVTAVLQQLLHAPKPAMLLPHKSCSRRTAALQHNWKALSADLWLWRDGALIERWSILGIMKLRSGSCSHRQH